MPDIGLAVDVGCGNGQFTRQLARHFVKVVGVDPSADQIAHAVADDAVEYACAPAEALPVVNDAVSLITAAQAAHWFDLPKFYAEVRRVAKPAGVLALISYGVPVLDAAVRKRFEQFYWDEIGRYWPSERRLVESGYAGIDFPFEEIKAPAMAIHREWNLAEFMGYVSTWSAIRRVEEAGKVDLVIRFGEDMERQWGDPAQSRPVKWPAILRLGRL